MSVKPFAAGNTLESLRDSDFDSCSAYGEVIDNSLQANAKTIKIHFDKKGRENIERVIFMDDGHGMDRDLLQNCLRLGWSSRYNDRTGIGRFGVGMTLGAIHECRRVEVYSKTAGGEWYFTYLDLDEIEALDQKNEEWVIPTPEKRSPLEIVAKEYVPNESGTIVLWSKYDRAQNKLSKILKDLNVWIGRTFRYYIWDKDNVRGSEVQIYLNGELVKAIDPLYVQTDKTRFPEDPSAEQFQDLTWDWPIGDPKIEKELGRDTGRITVKLSLLPEKFREYQGAGGSQEAKDRSIDLNEGFSFLRKGREVGYDWIPHFKFASEDKDRFWGCEIHFEPELDRAFTVKNIKRGAVPSSELKIAIADKLGPWIKQQREKIKEHWKKGPRPSDDGVELPSGGESHLPAENIVGGTAVPAGNMGAGKDSTKEITTVAELVSEGNTEEAAKWEAKFASQKFTIGEKSWLGPTFIDIHFMGGHDAILYNTRHKFFEVLSIIKNQIKNGDNVEDNAERLVVLIDVLLVAYAKAESMLNVDDQLLAIDFIDSLKSNWGQFLKSYITTWQNQYDQDIKL